MEQLILDLMREALMTVVKASLPILLTGLTIGLAVSIFQTATSIQEQTLAFIPKIIGTFLAIIIFGSWIMAIIVNFTTKILTNFNDYL